MPNGRLCIEYFGIEEEKLKKNDILKKNHIPWKKLLAASLIGAGLLTLTGCHGSKADRKSVV